MEQKAVFLDIDGTLVNSRGVIPQSAKEAVLQAKKNGHKMIICTGRSRFQIPDELFALGMDGVISGAGAYVEAADGAPVCRKTRGKILLQEVIDSVHAKQSYDYLEGNGFLYCYQAEDGIVLNRRSYDGMFQIDQLNGISEEMLQSLHGVIHIEEKPWEFPKLEKIIFYQAPFSLEKIRKDLLPYFDTVMLSLSGASGVAGEIGRNYIHKATGMKLFLENCGIGRENAIAIGDGPNDLQMMEFAGIGVAMGNARPEVQARADMTTTNIDEDGICHAFEVLGLLRA